jgi:hypothetical protein
VSGSTDRNAINHVGSKYFSHGQAGCDPQMRVPVPPQGRDTLFKIGSAIHRRLSPTGHQLTNGRQPRTACTPLQQACADLMLQLPQSRAHGRLGQLVRRCRAPDAAQLRHTQQQVEARQITDSRREGHQCSLCIGTEGPRVAMIVSPDVRISSPTPGQPEVRRAAAFSRGRAWGAHFFVTVSIPA